MPLYGLIDCACDPALYPMIRAEAEQQSLFAGTLSPELIGATPHILRLDPDSPFRETLRSRGWTLNWGIVCASEAPMSAVRRQMRRSLQAVLPDGRTALFRFYDPRVWVPFIEACSGPELDPWFGPPPEGVTDYWAPAPGGARHYRREGGRAVWRVEAAFGQAAPLSPSP